MKIELMKVEDLIPYQNNAKLHPKEQIDQIINSIKQFGFNDPIAIDENNRIIEGHGRLIALNKMGINEVETIKLSHLTDDQKKAYILAHNKLTMNTDFDLEMLELELGEIEIDMSEFGFDIDEEIENAEPNQTLVERFVVPPFSILDTKQGYWQDRKREWLSLGIKSEEGRDAECLNTNLGYKYGITNKMSGQSIFDPVLCEVVYKWFNIKNGTILDPFAGGSVRGIVASKLNYKYYGNDLSEKQIKANNDNATEVLSNGEIFPVWTCGDSKDIDVIAKEVKADLLFSCPPYADLEVYSDKKEDISNMDYNDFLKAYSIIIEKSCNMLKDDRFACFVVGDVRDKKGFYRNFVSDTIKCFEDAGMKLYNEIILVNMAGTLPIRVASSFPKYRKVGKQHQNVLVFYKGDPKKIKANYPEVETMTDENQI